MDDEIPYQADFGGDLPEGIECRVSGWLAVERGLRQQADMFDRAGDVGLVAQLAALWVVACVLSDHIVTPIMQRRKNGKTQRPGAGR